MPEFIRISTVQFIRCGRYIPPHRKAGTLPKFMNEIIEKAKMLAMKYHSGQVDKAGAEYFRHPEFVADHVDTDAEKITAYLHDILEDTDCSTETIRAIFGEEILDAVEALTRRNGEDYFDYVRRAAGNPIAKNVKRADLKHNLMIERIPEPTEKDYRRLEKYRQALIILEEA